MKIKLTKLEELPNALHPFNIEVGFTKIIELDAESIQPEIGDRFPSQASWYCWSTSIVRDIIDEHTFRTLNSIYKWEILS